MSENSKIYDITFKRMFRLSGRMLIKFVNKVFEKNFPLDSEIKFLDPNSEDEENAILEKDIYFEICGERFQIEAQTYWDDMMFRLFEYAVSNPGDGYEKTDDCHAEYRMPKQAVVFLKGKNRKHDKLYIKLILPDDQEVEYSVKAVRALSYTPQELVENDLEILLPFQIIRMYNRVNNYDSYTDKKKEQFLSDFKKMCKDIRYTMDSLLRDERVTNDEYHEMLNITCSLEEHIYSNIDDISKKGVDSMLNEKVMLRDDRIRAEAKAEAEEKRNKELAEMMIMDEEPAEKIERYTGFNLSDLKPLAKKLGKTLVI
ncbi:MAG: hypothetical protein MSH15_13760 [Oscillospiraceae bacterium]|nr:hypothetical protein [Oscillospiraceae bacterium]